MKRRCNHAHEYYSLRGITYTSAWESFEPFWRWSICNGYKDDLTLDRINGNQGYKPANCRWVSRKVQGRNTSRNKILTYKGTSQCMAAWAEEKNINYQTLTDRIRRGWSIERALCEN